MPKLQSFHMVIKTGERGREDIPQYAINGFQLPFELAEGSCESGATLEATGNPDSFPHSLHLIGPDEGEWDIEDIRITYFPTGQEEYTLRFGSVMLDSESSLNIWKQRPAPAFDV